LPTLSRGLPGTCGVRHVTVSDGSRLFRFVDVRVAPRSRRFDRGTVDLWRYVHISVGRGLGAARYGRDMHARPGAADCPPTAGLDCRLTADLTADREPSRYSGLAPRRSTQRP